MVQDASAILSDVNIREAIAIVVAHGHSLAIAAAGYPGFFSDVGESAVAVISIERVAQRRTWVVEITLAAIDQVNVHPAVVVVIEEGTTGSGGFGQVSRGGFSGGMDPADAAWCWGNLFERVVRIGECANKTR